MTTISDFGMAVHKGEVRHKPDAFQQQALRTWGDINKQHREQRFHALLGLAGETGELMDMLKKHFYKPGYEATPEMVKDELSDVLYYVAIISHLWEFSFDDMMVHLAVKLDDGHGWKKEEPGRKVRPKERTRYYPETVTFEMEFPRENYRDFAQWLYSPETQKAIAAALAPAARDLEQESVVDAAVRSVIEGTDFTREEVLAEMRQGPARIPRKMRVTLQPVERDAEEEE